MDIKERIEKKILLLNEFSNYCYMPEEKQIQQIDLDLIIKNKAPNIYPKIPKFLIGIVKKIVHEDGINDIILKNSHLYGVDFAKAVINYFNISIKIEGEENLPKDAATYTFASNHPLGGLDGLALADVLGSHYPSIKIMVNDLLMNLNNLESIFIPINKHGGQAKNAADIINQTYLSDVQLVVFPAGMVSRKTNGKIIDGEWKKNFISKTVQYQRNLVPIHFEGYNSKFFYRLANIRTKLGIKFNIEMLFLPHELFKQHNSSFTIKIGKPIPWQTFDKTHTHAEWADIVKKLVYEL